MKINCENVSKRITIRISDLKALRTIVYASSALLLSFIASITPSHAACNDLAGATVAPTFTCTGVNLSLYFQTNATTHSDPGDTFTGNLSLTLANSASASTIFAILSDGSNLNITTNNGSTILNVGDVGISTNVYGGAGNILINTSGSVTGTSGINSVVQSSSNITIQTSGNVSGTSLYGIRTEAIDGITNVTINSGSVVTGVVHGISSQTNSGAVTITNAGTISGGVEGKSTGTGNITIANTGTVNGGINNTSTGTGTLTINNNANGIINGRIRRDFAASVINFNNTIATSTWNVSGVISDVTNLTNNGIINLGSTSELNVNNVFLNRIGGFINSSGKIDTNYLYSDGGEIDLTNTSSIISNNIYNGSLSRISSAGSISAYSEIINDGAFYISGFINGKIINSGDFNVGGLLNGSILAGSNSIFINKISGNLNISLGNYMMSGFALTNSGTVNISATRTLSVNTFTNNAGAVLNNNGTLNFATSLVNAGTLNGSVTNSTTLTNTGIVNASIINTATGTLTTTGTLNNTLTNSGTVNAQGTINGTVSNSNVFNVSGLLNGNAAFTNNGAGTLNVSLGNYLMAGSNLSNSGTVNISAARTLSVNTFTNNAGAVLNNNGTLNFATSLVNAGTLNGSITNSTTLTNTGIINGSVINTSTGILTTTGTLNNTLTNSGTVNAQGTITGAIVQNAGAFNVTGALTGAPSFTNNGGILNISSGNFTGLTTLLNRGTINISGSPLRLLSANIMTNDATGIINNNGTLSSTGIFTNQGIITSTGALNAGSNLINNGTLNAQGTLTTPLVSNNGRINVTAPLNITSATLNNNAGGQVLLQNNSTLNTGNYNNAGLTTLSSGSSLNVNGTLNNTGNINLLNGVPSNAVNVTGAYTGNGVFSVDVDFVNGQADRLNAQGGSGRTLLVINPIGTPNFKSDILIVSGATGATFESVINLPSNGAPNPFGSSGGQVVHTSGLFQQWFGQAANGEFVIRSDINPVAVSSLSGSIASLLASVSTFQEPSSAFIGAPANPDPNTFSIGTWGRGRAGSFDIKTSNLVGSPFGVDRHLSHEAATQFSGMQLGIDAGLYNINNTGWSVNVGTIGGLVEGKSKSSAGDMIELSQGFGGIYSVISNGAFTLDLSARHENFDMKVTAPLANARNTPLKAEGWSGLANMQYIYTLTDTLYIAPAASFIYSKTQIDDLPMNQVTMSWRAIESASGRLGLVIGTSFKLTDSIAISPYIGASVWHEFAGKAKSLASIGSDGIFPVSTDRLGTYGQASIGMKVASPTPNVSGFVRADMRFGEKIEGYAINGGLRYQF